MRERTNGSRRDEVAAHHSVTRIGEVSIAVGTHDNGRELVIDPVINYATYLGGLLDDQALAIAVDVSGSGYVTGSFTRSTSDGLGLNSGRNVLRAYQTTPTYKG